MCSCRPSKQQIWMLLLLLLLVWLTVTLLPALRSS
jgi:hypothetical protein